MATVNEIKQALLADQAETIEATATAIAAINTLLNLSMFALSILGLVIAVIALFGYVAIRGAAVDEAKKVATHRIESYIKSQEFLDQLDRTVQEEVKRRVKDKIILAHLTEESDGEEPDPFPSLSEAKK